MAPHQQRVVEEKDDLDGKCNRLAGFISGDVFSNLDEAEKSRLNRQLVVMSSYSEILAERITAFNN